MTKRDKKTLPKIVGYIDNVYEYRQGLELDSFLSDKKVLAACSFAVLQIGELVKDLSEDILNSNVDIPWKSIRGMRNRIVHDYENVDLAVLWKTIDKDLPQLKIRLTELLDNS